MNYDTQDLISLYDGARELVYDGNVYTMSQSFEQDCRRYSRALCDEQEVKAS